MLGRTRAEYLALRRKFTPERLKLVVVAESPPASGRYFYDAAGSHGEPLFAALMKLLGHSSETKEDGLQKFGRNGWLLVDATYTPVNTLDDSDRNRMIVEHYPLLRDDLESLMSDRSTPLILIKANVCKILEPRLLKDGFNVINCGHRIYFPAMGHQGKFLDQVRAVLSSENVKLL